MVIMVFMVLIRIRMMIRMMLTLLMKMMLKIVTTKAMIMIPTMKQMMPINKMITLYRWQLTFCRQSHNTCSPSAPNTQSHWAGLPIYTAEKMVANCTVKMVANCTVKMPRHVHWLTRLPRLWDDWLCANHSLRYQVYLSTPPPPTLPPSPPSPSPPPPPTLPMFGNRAPSCVVY